MTKQTFTTGQVLTAAQMTSLQQTAMGGGSTTAKTASYTLVALDAGTVVQMNSASATTITVNTALFAAGDTVQIQNVGAGVCTVTAGTATVSTSATLALKQYDAGTLYFNTTSAAFFFAVDAADTPLTTTGDIIYSSSGSTAARLGIGSTNQALGVSGGIPAWQASSKSTLTTTGDIIYASAANTPARLGIGSAGQVLNVSGGIPAWTTASSGGMTLLSTTTLSGATTTISSIDQTYIRLFMLIINPTNATATGRFGIAPNNDSGSANGITIAYSNNAGYGPSTTGGNTTINPGINQVYTNGAASFALTIDNYTRTSYQPWLMNGYLYSTTPTNFSFITGGAWLGGAAITSLVFSNTGGNFNAGTVYLYGVK